MDVKHTIIIIFVMCLIIATGCRSVQYEYNDPIAIDTMHIKADTTSSTNTALNATLVKNYYVRTSPEFTLQINASYNNGISELDANIGNRNQVAQFESGQNFGTRSGFGVIVLGKKPLMNYENLRIIFMGSANFFSNNKFASKVSEDGKINYQVYSVGAGLENSFTPSFKVKPYIGAAILLNAISGHAAYINDNGENTDITFKPSLRIGVKLSTGLEYLFSDKIGLNLGISLVSANLLLKQSHVSDDPNNIYIRDRRRSDMPLFLSGYKQFLFTSFYTGINIYFGIKEKSFRF